MIEKGTWLTISIKDYRENVLEILPEPEEIEEETDEQISGMFRLMFRDMAIALLCCCHIPYLVAH